MAELKYREYCLLCFLMVISGTLTTVLNKLIVSQNSLGMPFHHAWFLTFIMFLAELSCFLYYFLSLLLKKLRLTGESVNGYNEFEYELKEPNPLLFLIPSFLDLIGSFSLILSLIMITASTYQMLKATFIIMVVIISKIFFKTELFSQHYLGIALMTIGSIIVALAGHYNSDNESSIWGVFLVIFGQLISAIQYHVEEYILKDYKSDSLKTVGWEGLWGTVMSIIILICFQLIPCSEGSKICCSDDEGHVNLENTIFAWKQLQENYVLTFLLVGFLIIVSFYNIFLIVMTKHFSTTTRVVNDSIRNIFVWLYFIIVSPLIEENLYEEFSIYQLIGFITQVLGILIFHEIITIPICGLNSNTREENKEVEKDITILEEKIYGLSKKKYNFLLESERSNRYL